MLFRSAEGEAGRIAAKVRLRLEAEGLDADALRRRVAEEPGDLDARWGLATALAGAEDHEGALGELLEIVRRNRRYRDDGARKEMLRIFEVVGARSAIADRWRDRLAKALY